MQTYRLRHRDHTTLFEGDYRNIRDCVEDALARGISLHGADFRNMDLSEINLDGVYICHGDFAGANLTGANMSEARLHDDELPSRIEMQPVELVHYGKRIKKKIMSKIKNGTQFNVPASTAASA